MALRIGEEVLRLCKGSLSEDLRLLVVSASGGPAALLEVNRDGKLTVYPFTASVEALREEVLGKKALVLYLEEKAFDSIAGGRSSLVEELARGRIRVIGRIDLLLC